MSIVKKFRFRNFKVYSDSRVFIKELKLLCLNKFPKEEKYSLFSQISRAADSIILNIAEGSDRGSDKDFARFLNTSHTSLNEVVACLDIAFDNGYIEETELETWLIKAKQLANQLTAFRRKLLTNNS